MELLKQQQQTLRLLSSAKRRNALHNVLEGLSLSEFQYRLVDKDEPRSKEKNPIRSPELSSESRATRAPQKVGRTSVH